MKILGVYKETWNGNDLNNKFISSDVYFICIKSDSKI